MSLSEEWLNRPENRAIKEAMEKAERSAFHEPSPDESEEERSNREFMERCSPAADEKFIRLAYNLSESEYKKFLEQREIGAALTEEFIRHEAMKAGGANGYTEKELVIREVIRDNFTKGFIKIGFPRLKDEKELLSKLKDCGFRKPFFTNGRQFIRDLIGTSDDAFFFLRNDCCIHGVWQSKDSCWDLAGRLKDWEWYHKSGILIKIDGVVEHFGGLLEGVWGFWRGLADRR